MATLEHFIGAGQIHFDGRDVGNASDAELAIETSEQTVPNFRGGGGVAATITRIESVSFKATLYDFNPKNLAMALRGTTTALSATPLTDEVLPGIPATVTEDTLFKTVQLIDVAVAPVVTGTGGTPTRVLDTDYRVVAGGIIAVGGGGMTTADEVDYTPLANTRLDALTTGELEFEVVINGVNEAENKPFRFTGYKYRPAPATALALISESFGSFELDGKLILDTTKVGVGESQYFDQIG